MFNYKSNYILIILAFFLGFVVCLATTYHNYKEFVEPQQELSDKLLFCDTFAAKSQALVQYEPENKNITLYVSWLKNYTVSARQYFLCVQSAYGFNKIE